MDCLRPDGLGADDEAILTSIAQFDILANIVAIDDAQSTDPKVFYPNFARFRQDRIQGIIDRLISDGAMRQELFHHDDEELAVALSEVGRAGQREGIRYNGFFGWDRSAVAGFIAAHHPDRQ